MYLKAARYDTSPVSTAYCRVVYGPGKKKESDVYGLRVIWTHGPLFNGIQPCTSTDYRPISAGTQEFYVEIPNEDNLRHNVDLLEDQYYTLFVFNVNFAEGPCHSWCVIRDENRETSSSILRLVNLIPSCTTQLNVFAMPSLTNEKALLSLPPTEFTKQSSYASLLPQECYEFQVKLEPTSSEGVKSRKSKWLAPMYPGFTYSLVSFECPESGEAGVAIIQDYPLIRAQYVPPDGYHETSSLFEAPTKTSNVDEAIDPRLLSLSARGGRASFSSSSQPAVVDDIVRGDGVRFTFTPYVTVKSVLHLPADTLLDHDPEHQVARLEGVNLQCSSDVGKLQVASATVTTNDNSCARDDVLLKVSPHEPKYDTPKESENLSSGSPVTNFKPPAYYEAQVIYPQSTRGVSTKKHQGVGSFKACKEDTRPVRQSNLAILTRGVPTRGVSTGAVVGTRFQRKEGPLVKSNRVRESQFATLIPNSYSTAATAAASNTVTTTAASATTTTTATTTTKDNSTTTTPDLTTPMQSPMSLSPDRGYEPQLSTLVHVGKSVIDLNRMCHVPSMALHLDNDQKGTQSALKSSVRPSTVSYPLANHSNIAGKCISDVNVPSSLAPLPTTAFHTCGYEEGYCNFGEQGNEPNCTRCGQSWVADRIRELPLSDIPKCTSGLDDRKIIFGSSHCYGSIIFSIITDVSVKVGNFYGCDIYELSSRERTYYDETICGLITLMEHTFSAFVHEGHTFDFDVDHRTYRVHDMHPRSNIIRCLRYEHRNGGMLYAVVALLATTSLTLSVIDNRIRYPRVDRAFIVQLKVCPSLCGRVSIRDIRVASLQSNSNSTPECLTYRIYHTDDNMPIKVDIGGRTCLIERTTLRYTERTIFTCTEPQGLSIASYEYCDITHGRAYACTFELPLETTKVGDFIGGFARVVDSGLSTCGRKVNLSLLLSHVDEGTKCLYFNIDERAYFIEFKHLSLVMQNVFYEHLGDWCHRVGSSKRLLTIAYHRELYIELPRPHVFVGNFSDSTLVYERFTHFTSTSRCFRILNYDRPRSIQFDVGVTRFDLKELSGSRTVLKFKTHRIDREDYFSSIGKVNPLEEVYYTVERDLTTTFVDVVSRGVAVLFMSNPDIRPLFTGCQIRMLSSSSCSSSIRKSPRMYLMYYNLDGIAPQCHLEMNISANHDLQLDQPISIFNKDCIGCDDFSACQKLLHECGIIIGTNSQTSLFKGERENLLELMYTSEESMPLRSCGWKSCVYPLVYIQFTIRVAPHENPPRVEAASCDYVIISTHVTGNIRSENLIARLLVQDTQNTSWLVGGKSFTFPVERALVVSGQPLRFKVNLEEPM